MKELIEIQKELKAPKWQKNTFWNYNYRSCEDIMEAVKPLLHSRECFITVSDTLENIGNYNYVKATATIYKWDTSISTTAYAREADTKKGMDSSQITGATSSYARKYALNGLLAIDDTKDADTMDNSKPKLDKDWAYKWDSSQLELTEYIEIVKDETDVNNLDTIYKDFVRWNWSEKQKKWMVEECAKKKAELTGGVYIPKT